MTSCTATVAETGHQQDMLQFVNLVNSMFSAVVLCVLQFVNLVNSMFSAVVLCGTFTTLKSH